MADAHINPQSGVWDDNYYANVGKYGGGDSGGGGGGGSVDSIIQNAIQSLSGLFPKPVKPYDEVNPFTFDEALAKDASTKEYAPYYQELLTDYTSNVERTKSRSQEDLTKTLDQLAAGKEYYTGTQRRLLDKTLLNTNSGYAGRGLFFSGAREKDITDINTQYGADTANYEKNYQYNVGQANTSAQRTGQDVSTALSNYTRDTNREQQTAVAQGVLQRKSEAQNQYEIGRQKYYDAAQYGA